MDSSDTKCGSVSGSWEQGNGSPTGDEGWEFLSRLNKYCFLCYVELVSYILHFSSLVQLCNGISGHLFFYVLSHTQNNCKFYPRYANIARSMWDITREWLLVEL
jgi:hypothetical protein